MTANNILGAIKDEIALDAANRIESVIRSISGVSPGLLSENKTRRIAQIQVIIIDAINATLKAI